MRRLAKYGVAVATCGLILSACGTAADDEDNANDEVEAKCDPVQIEGDVKVGLAYDVGGRGDQSFNDSAYAGLERAQTELGIAEVTEGEAAQDEPEEVREERLRTFADAGHNVIVGVGFAYSTAVDTVAPEYPNVSFGVIDGFDPTEDDVNCNVAYLGFAEHEGSYLVGAAAALQSETGQLGFVGGVNNPLIQKFEAGFEAGAKAADPDVEVTSTYIEEKDTKGFQDPAGGKAAAQGLYSEGADIVFHAAGASGSGVFDAAVEADMLAIGVDSDQYLTASEAQKPRILTSMLKRVDTATFGFIESAVNGEPDQGFTTFTLADEGVGYSESGGFLTPETIAELEKYKADIISGDVEVPTEP